jgi:23S rRNA (pseudouridine1915-N3)-methyltransferase
MRNIIIAVESTKATKNSPYSAIAADLLQKINHYSQAEYLSVTSDDSALAQTRKSAEAKSILSILKPNDFLILLDERGVALDSISLAKKIDNIEQFSPRTIWLIGGAYGVDKSIFERANLCLKLSDLVLAHQVAKIVILEQIYRAYNIKNNTKYHHA